jgi:chromosome segregation ATPase
MGEQSAKQLRGRSMEDVIFNGSESRGPRLAEVTITFSNSDPSYAEMLPPEDQSSPEISVTRRLFREGTIAYLLNNRRSACATSPTSSSAPASAPRPTRSSSRGASA